MLAHFFDVKALRHFGIGYYWKIINSGMIVNISQFKRYKVFKDGWW